MEKHKRSTKENKRTKRVLHSRLVELKPDGV